MTARRCYPRRAVVLLAVLMVLVIGALIGSTLAGRASADVDAARFRTHEGQARGAAWSGVLAAMTELGAHRRELLAGGSVRLTPGFTLTRADESLVVATSLHETDAGPDVRAQGALLCVNGTTAEMLAASGVVDATGAGAIAARAAAEPFTSVEEALLLTGEPKGGEPVAQPTGAAPARAEVPGSPAPATPAPQDVLTAYSFDPEVCAGVDDADRVGQERSSWESVLETKGNPDALTRMFGPDAGKAIEKVVAGGAKIASRGALVNAMRGAGMNPRLWGVVIDRVRLGEETATGRVDLTSASGAVLGTVPGIGAELGATLVRTRERLTDEAKRSVAWPVVEGVLTAEQFQGAVDHLTTRSTQYRVRVEGTVRVRAARGAEESEAPALARVVYDAVIDVSAERPRVAYLRDVTLAGVAAAVRGKMAPPAQPAGASAGAVAEESSGPVLDEPPRRAQNDGGAPAASGRPSGPEPAAGAPDRTHGRVGRWTPGPRSRGGG